MTATLTPAQRTAVSKIAGLTIANAMVFQEVLSAHEQRVYPLRQMLQATDPITELSTHWQFILDEIDYVPIFRVARDLLLELPANQDIEDAIRFMGDRALDIVRLRAALRHDLVGRVYHKLLAHAKFLGTYYTSVPAATLLLKVALSSQIEERNWADIENLGALRIADLACGTGTLLMAAAEAVTDNYVRAVSAQDIRPDLRELHQLLIEKVIHGYDVLPSALHLTASTLALRASDMTFQLTNLFSLPLGGPGHWLGSIEFLKDRKIPITRDMFGAPTIAGQVTAKGDISYHIAPLPDLDLCVMNPPFTRSVGGNLLFGSLPESERRPMQKELARLLRTKQVLASSTAGLGSVFVAVGDRAVKEGGRMALVLPKALLSGVAWGKTRELFRQSYQVEHLIVSHDPARWNFSENTDLSEVLVVARKVGEEAAQHHRGRVVCVNLWRNPGTAFEALSMAQSLTRGEPPDVERGQGALDVSVGGTKVGEALSVPWSAICDGLWMPPCAFGQSELVRAAHHLVQGHLYLPGGGIVGTLPLCPLQDIGSLGPDRRDIHDGFSLATGETAFPAFWGHDAPLCTTLAQRPNRYLSPLSQAKPGRHLRRVQDLWPKAGRIVLAERLRLNTQRLVAVRIDRPVLSNVWWPFTPMTAAEAAEKALVLWLNSTLGLLVLLAHREETQGAWVDFKKPVLGAMPVLDVHALSSEQLDTLARTFDSLSGQEILPFPFMADDAVRQEIDQTVARVFGLPDFAVLRWLLSREPVVCLRSLP